MTRHDFTIAALYHFTPFPDPASLRAPLLEKCRAHAICGTLLLAQEGINGTIAGRDKDIHAILAEIKALPGCESLEWKLSYADAPPFHRMKIRLKKEIVTMGQPAIDPLKSVGRYVTPEAWNALISDPDTIVIDTRNDYEVAIGSFQRAIDPGTKSFRDFPEWFRQFRAQQAQKGRKAKLAMFCTGGIRCEKATAFAREEGFKDVYHLKGGILKYLETVPEAESLWQGDCFVFDHRVSVQHGLKPGNYALCHACRMPLSPEDRASPLYVEGESCPHCHHARNARQRARYAARQRQMALAQARGTVHLGHPSATRPPSGTKRDA